MISLPGPIPEPGAFGVSGLIIFYTLAYLPPQGEGGWPEHPVALIGFEDLFDRLIRTFSPVLHKLSTTGRIATNQPPGVKRSAVSPAPVWQMNPIS